MIGLPGVI